MASLRNAVKRKTHKERSQPSQRSRLGLLEKHSDYVFRAKNFHKNQNKLKALQIKAAFKNPDEFNRGMIKHKLTKDGQHVLYRPQLDAETIKLYQTQNLGYLEMIRTQELKKIDKLKANLHFIDTSSGFEGKKPNKHTIFIDPGEVEESQQHEKGSLTIANHGGIDRTRADAQHVELTKKARNAQQRSYKELSERMNRYEKISNVIAHIQLRKNLAAKGRKDKVKEAVDDKPAVFKWRRERKR